MRRAYLLAVGLVIALIGIAAFVTLSYTAQPKPVRVTFLVGSYNGAGGCLNVASMPVAILKLDGVPLKVGNATSPFSDIFNGTTITLKSGSAHVISANQTYTGTCNGCAECGGTNGKLTAFFGGWVNNATSVLGHANNLDFQVPSNDSTVIIAGYNVA